MHDPRARNDIRQGTDLKIMLYALAAVIALIAVGAAIGGPSFGESSLFDTAAYP